MKRKLLVICGQTALGKSKTALKLAQIISGEIISADSRQVYQGMDIATGKDLPQGSTLSHFTGTIKSGEMSGSNTSGKGNNIGFYNINGVRVWGYDLVKPTDDFNVSYYFNIGNEIINDVWNRKKLPIIVGGTGFYIKALIDGIDTISIKPDSDLRDKLYRLSREELYKILIKVDKKKAFSMNDSDSKNRVRLVRAIEIAFLRNKGKEKSGKMSKTGETKGIKYDSILMIGLYAPKKELDERISERVHKRFKEGFDKEIKGLLKKGIDWRCKAMRGMGYRQYESYFNKAETRSGFIEKWIKEEQKYAKRQLVWFGKDKRIKWFDVTVKNWEVNMEKVVKNWYYEY